MKTPFEENKQKSRNQKEFALQCHIVERHEQYFPHVIMTTFPGRPGDAQDGFFKKMMGVRAGVSDILIWWSYDYPLWALKWLTKMTEYLGFGFSKVHCGLVELKVDSKASSAQNKFMSTMNSYGAKEGIVYSWEQYYKLLCSWGIKPHYICTIFDEPNYATEQQKFAANFDFFAPQKEDKP